MNRRRIIQLRAWSIATGVSLLVAVWLIGGAP